MYHEVDPRPDPRFRRFTVTPAELRSQMRWLARAGFRSIDLDELLRARETGAPLPARPLVITFDDGFAAAARHAPPILSEHGFTAVFYLVAGLVGGTSRWLPAEVGLELPMLDWETARGLEAMGFRCGSHTVSHPRLARLDPAALRVELSRSRSLLERQLGHPVDHLSYPFGSHDERVVRLAGEAGYRSGCTTVEGLSDGSDLPLALRRIPVEGGETGPDVLCRALTGRPLRAWGRRALRGARARVRSRWTRPG
jgi:peptidoglycan/xylan/chitin deacetylase (PgdA/CDA1 family)